MHVYIHSKHLHKKKHGDSYSGNYLKMAVVYFQYVFKLGRYIKKKKKKINETSTHFPS